MKKTQSQSGVVSLFIVIFTALLMTVIVVSFVRIMIRDQQQASATDLSQSAYDSAQAGVEDAKRALLRYQHACSSGGDAGECARLQSAFDADKCDTIFQAIGVGELGASETVIRQSESDNSLDQAYTCVKIKLDTEDYLGQLGAEESKLIQLTGVDAFDTVELSWFSYQDFSSRTVDRAVSLGSDADLPLPQADSGLWQFNQPSIMRVQLMQTNKVSFDLSSFDDSSNAKSLTLYPSTSGLSAADEVAFITDISRASPVGSTAIKCKSDVNDGGYACKARLKLPDPAGGDPSSRVAFLRLAAFYNRSHFKIALYNDTTLVNFKAVQPSVDSTGRANDLFRRVESRVELQDTTFPYPEAALDLKGSLCKDFRITDKDADYSSLCAPATP